MPREKIPTTPGAKKPVARKKVETPVTITRASFVGPEQRAALIAEAAYFRAESRGFQPGQEMEDWLAAEADVDARLLRGADSASQA